MKNDYKEENVLSIETYLVWKNQRIAAKDFIKEAIKELEDYKSRIDKAIEYIEHNDIMKVSKEEETKGCIFCCDIELLKILKGEENENN